MQDESISQETFMKIKTLKLDQIFEFANSTTSPNEHILLYDQYSDMFAKSWLKSESLLKNTEFMEFH